MHTWPGGSCPTKPRHSHVSRRQRSFTSLDSSSSFFALRWPAGRSPRTFLCTHDIARRLLPMPRCGVRALTGYFGRGVGCWCRSADHVEATASSGGELVRLSRRRIPTWSVLQEWSRRQLAASRQRRRRVWRCHAMCGSHCPMRAGVYRMLRTIRATSCTSGRPPRSAIASTATFGSETGVPERTLEMLTQARGIFRCRAKRLEAASSSLRNKRHRPRPRRQHSPSRARVYRSHHRSPTARSGHSSYSVRSDRSLRRNARCLISCAHRR